MTRHSCNVRCSVVVGKDADGSRRRLRCTIFWCCWLWQYCTLIVPYTCTVLPCVSGSDASDRGVNGCGASGQCLAVTTPYQLEAPVTGLTQETDWLTAEWRISPWSKQFWKLDQKSSLWRKLFTRSYINITFVYDELRSSPPRTSSSPPPSSSYSWQEQK